jgi:autoinducer 2 (AI-2) kinase
MGDNLLALDLGTSNLHCLVSDAKGSVIASSASRVETYSPPEGPQLAREMNAGNIMDITRQVVTNCLKEAGISAKDIIAIGITGQRQGIALMDEAGGELLLSPNIDLRASFDGLSLEERWGEEMYGITGHFPLLLLAAAKIYWVRENRPDIFRRLRCLLTLPGWLVYRMTGEVVCEPSLAASAGLLDIRNHQRPTNLLSNFGVSSEMLPPLMKAGMVAGLLKESVAKHLGLLPGTPVTLSGADTQCGLLGMGVLEAFQTGIVAGWSCSVQSLTKQPCQDAQTNSWNGCYLMDGLWTLEANLGDAGNAHRWLKTMLMGKEMPWEYADSLAESMEPGSGGVTCFLGPNPRSAAKARLQRGGVTFQTPLSYEEANPGQVLNAFYENLSYSLKANIGSMESITGQTSKMLNLGGGMAQSLVLAKTISDVLGRPVRRSTCHDVSALGASMAAATAAGLYANLAEACQAMSSGFELVEPDVVRNLEYQGLFEQWKSLYQRIQDS